jgi:rSAM/selenodomain-associated transferase 1
MNDSSRPRQSSLVIIFYRNPELGKVKTRLAKTIGEEMALAIYIKLSSHTRQTTEQLKVDKAVYYSHFVDTEDHWPNELYYKEVQHGNDLGEKMSNALADAFAKGYQRVCVIGTDCLELTPSIIDTAFFQLEKFDAIIGPARDGGYYLLGMKKLFPEFFQNKAWSTNTIASDTIADFKKLGLRYFCLETLTDVDEERDLPASMLAGK